MVSPETLSDIVELRELLGLDPDADDFHLVYGATASSRHEIAVQTRSLLHILNIMAGYVDVPMEDIRDGRATPGVGSSGEAGRGVTKPKIRSSPDKPVDAFTSVQYQGQWFWVDNRDLATKRSFSFMMLIFTLADSSDRENLPLLTIPAQ